MKEFDKWYLPDKDIYTNEYEMQKRAWEAALEWALSNFNGKNDILTIGLNIGNELIGDKDGSS